MQHVKDLYFWFGDDAATDTDDQHLDDDQEKYKYIISTI